MLRIQSNCELAPLKSAGAGGREIGATKCGKIETLKLEPVAGLAQFQSHLPCLDRRLAGAIKLDRIGVKPDCRVKPSAGGKKA